MKGSWHAASFINHILERFPEIKEQLMEHAGYSFSLSVPGCTGRYMLGTGGEVFVTQRPEVHVSLALSAKALLTLQRGQLPEVSDVCLEGDEALGWSLLKIWADARYSVADALSEIGGESAASLWVSLLEQPVHRFSEHVRRQCLSADFTWFVSRRAVTAQLQELMMIREDLTHLKQRVSVLEQSHVS